MKIALKIIGILIIVFSSLYLLFCLLIMSMSESYGINAPTSIVLVPIIILSVGIILTILSSKNDVNKKELEEYRRFKQQEREIYYRYADSKGTSINEYLMDDRTKLVTYYDRMPSSYRKKLVEYADTLYRRFESEQYTKK
ncbi:MAG: hypothetical protein J6C96_00505 [Oscillospiraceae bacterium]|nr:hypothetical protein [Oscillospiraceae bacterium]